MGIKSNDQSARHQRRLSKIRKVASQVDSMSFFNLLSGPELLEKLEALLPEYRERKYPPIVTLAMFLGQAVRLPLERSEHLEAMDTSQAYYRENSVYFFVRFEDPELRVPIIRTVWFAGTKEREDGSKILFFRDADSQAQVKKIWFEESSVREVVVNGEDLLEKVQKSFAGTLPLC